jgi:gliding motility-associated-like protein
MIKNSNIFKLYISVLLCVSVFVLKAQNPFIKNQGQFPKQVKAKVNLPSGSLFIENGKSVYAFYSADQLVSIHDLSATSKEIDAHAYEMQFINSNTDASTEFLDESRYYENYFLGDKSKWAVNVKSYKSIHQNNVYNGIDIQYYVDNGKLKYDIIVAPNVIPNLIKIKYTGLDKIILDNGNLYITTVVNTVKESQPFAYQIINDNKIEVSCIYVLKKDILSFSFPEGYNENYDLIIDPILEFSSYSGSTADNFGYTATYDNFGFLYAGSTSFGTGYPTTIGAYQINYANTSGGTDIAITKYDTTGTQRIFSTYLGGSLDDLPHSMIVNSANELFIYGTTASADFPTTSSAFQQNFNGGTGFSPSGIGVSFPNGSDLFVSRLSANGGNLLASTFIGGTGNDGLNTATKLKYNYADEVRGEIDIDQQNNIYIATCTNSNDFPTTNSFQINSNGGQDGCIVKMDNQLTTIIWSTYLGGINDDAIYSLALDVNDDIYVTGGTISSDFPTSTNAYQDSYQDSINADAFITKISSNGSQVLASSYFGTSQYDQAYFVEIGSTNAVYLFGQTKMTGTQLVNNATYSVVDGGQFISVFDENLSSVLRSTIVGTGKGTPDISPTAFLVDVCDKIYIAGWGSNLGGPLSTLNLPVSYNAFQETTDGNDFYLMVLDDALSTMIYATYYGGSQSNEHVDGGTSRFDKKGIIYQSVCAGCGGNSDFPIEPNPGAVSTTNNSLNCNNGVFKFNFDFPMVVADFNAPFVGCDTTISFQNLTFSSTAVSYSWDFGDGNVSNAIHPTHNFSQNGLYTITLIATDNNACNVVDTIVKQIYILSNSSDTIQNILKCYNDQIQIGLLPVNDPTITYFWFPSTNLSSSTTSNPFCDVNSNQQYQLLISNGGCIDTLFQNILVTNLELDAGSDTSYCNTPILLSATFSSSVNYIHWSSNDNFSDTLGTSSDLIVASIDVFYIKISDGSCVQIDSVEVFTESINIDLFANDVCIGDSTLVGVTNLNTSIPISSYNWSANNLDTSSFIDYPDSNKWYSVEVVNTDGCIITDSIFVNVYDYPIIDSIWASDTIIFKGEEIILNITTNDNINWDDFQNSNSSQTLLPDKKKCYKFEVFNLFNCSIKDSICIDVKDVFCDNKNLKIPTAFSPNDDNINDTYYIDDKDGIITNFKLEIFNRLGQKVFASSDIFNYWNGNFHGHKLSPQVFDFYLELECIGEKKLFHKGNITLVR